MRCFRQSAAHKSKESHDWQALFHCAFCAPNSLYVSELKISFQDISITLPIRSCLSTKKSQGYMSPLYSTTKYWQQFRPILHTGVEPSTILERIESKWRIETVRLSLRYHSSKSSHIKTPHSFPLMEKGKGSPS